MNHRWIWSLVSTVLVLFLATACQDQPPVVSSPTALPPIVITLTPAPSLGSPTAAAKTTPSVPAKTASPQQTAIPKAALTCPAPAALPANAQLAARVNGQGISLDLFNRQMAQAQAAFMQQGVDVKSASGQEALKSLRQQVLDQMINEVVIEQRAEKETPPVRVSEAEVNARLAQMIQDAGSVDKLNEYLAKNQLSLADFCSQIRSNMLGEAMLDRITAKLPTQQEQVHARQILVSTAALAQTLRDRARKGEDFGALARQYSMDETSKANGGDLGWVPKGVLAPELDAVMFQLSVNQVSDVITTQFGYHVVQVLEKDKARALPPEMVQNARQSAFLATLQAWRETMKIERFVQ